MAEGKEQVLSNRGKRQKSVRKPAIMDPYIIILIHVNNYHWVTMVWQVQAHNKLTFYYADDLNCNQTKVKVEQLVRSERADPQFCPPDATWVVCPSITYHPHMNECGPRALMHASVMALHPMPYQNMLMPLMHPNLAKIARVFTAKTIVEQTCC